MKRAAHVEPLLPAAHGLCPRGGVYAWRRDGERHMWDPETIATLQRAARGNGDGRVHYAAFAQRVNEENAQHGLIRGLLRMKQQGPPVALDEVGAAEIVKRFSTGAMSLGALSPEAHETLAIAMNRIGGRSNSGEAARTRAATRASGTATGAARRSSRSPRAASA